MLKFVARRLGGLVFVMFIALVMTFIANQLVPGDPISTMLGDHSANAEMVARLRKEYGLDRPLQEQFFHYLAGVATGDFGLSFRYMSVPVVDVIKTGLAISPLLALAALVIAIPLGLFLGVAAALRRNTLGDTAIILLVVAGTSIPNFAVATFLVYLLSIKLGMLPVAGWGTFNHAVMPVIILAIPPIAYIARLTRTYMLETLQQDYVRTAKAKGLPKRLVVYRHALRNVLVPLLTTIGIIFGGLLSGTFVVETIFNIPGLGSLAIQSVLARDYPVTMAIVLLFTLFYGLINLIIDIAYGLLDPRIRLAA